MYSNFKEQAIEYVKQAVHEDNAGNYAKAFPLYMNALEYFKTHLKYEKNPKIREAITQKFTEYLRRAEEIRAVLDDGGPGPASNGDAAVATRPKSKGKDGGGKDGDGGGDGEDPEQAKLRAGLNSAIIREKPNVKWNDVAGLESAKQALQEAVILPVKFPQFFTGKRRPWRAFLLYGPPGTGKSYLAKAVATEADSTFFSISSSDLVSKWMGESEKLVSNLFQMARESAPSIIFIDEIDSLCGQRGEGNESEASRRIKTELLVQMQGVGNNDQKVLVLAATNTPYALDQAIRRRFDKRIYIPLPELKARQHMFKVHLGDTPHNLTESDFEYLGSRTGGFSGSDIAVCVKDVLFEPVRKTQDAMFFFKSPEGMWIPCGPKQQGAVQTTMQDLATQGLASKILPPPITRTDFEKVLARQRPTVSKSDLEVHERFTKEFGEEAQMDLEQSVGNLQAQNVQFQEMILNLTKGQEEMQALLTKEKKDQHKQQGGQRTWKSKPKRSFTPLQMPLYQALQQLLDQGLITLLPPYTAPTNPAPRYRHNVRCAYHSYSPGHDTEDCWPLKHKIQDLIDEKIIDFSPPEKPHEANAVYNQKSYNRNARNQSVGAVSISTLAPQQQRKLNAPRRQFTRINMSLAQALQQLLKAELITLKDPPRNPSTSSSRYNPNARCAYHSNCPGHDTNNCWTLKNKIQDMIEAGEIEFGSPETPSVITSTMSTHDNID